MVVGVTIREPKANRVAFDVCLIRKAVVDGVFSITKWGFDNIQMADNDDNISHDITAFVTYEEKVDMAQGDPFISYTKAPE